MHAASLPVIQNNHESINIIIIILLYSFLKTQRENGWERKYEVVFYNQYVQHHPWGERPRPYNHEGFALSVSTLCHTTHKKQADTIEANMFQFTPNPKYGKTYDFIPGCPFGESYSCVQSAIPGPDSECYERIPRDRELFPGHYSWWGLVSEVDLQLDNPPPYLRSPPESMYGGHSFTIGFTNLLESYRDSRNCNKSKICLKIGGTLRYKREIGYVVIVCTTRKRDCEMLEKYDRITNAPPTIFNPNGLVDDDGIVVDLDAEPIFTTRYINASDSYENLIFAFFFPKLQYFTCSEDTIKRQPIKHDFCIRKVSPGFGETMVCPDEIN